MAIPWVSFAPRLPLPLLVALGSACVVALTSLVCALAPLPWRHRASQLLRSLARRRMVAMVLLASAVLAVRLALLPFIPVPQPVIADEFSYLLLGGTLASGRLANPTHPLWPHFETLFVLQTPVYASVYPPMQGIALALGKLLGHPWLGVWLSVGAMCTAIGWMLLGWLPPKWALLGALLTSIQLGVTGYWANSYWGGAPAAIGGALVLGAAPRILRRARASDAIWFAVGLCILANSRPYEGFVVSLPSVFMVTAAWARSRGASLRQVVSASTVLLLGGAATGYYFWRITGSPFRMPQQLYIEQYAATPAFIWQSPGPTPAYRHDVLRDAHQSFRVDYDRYRSFAGILGRSFEKLAYIAQFYLGPLWIVPLALLPAVLRESGRCGTGSATHMRLLLASIGLGLWAILLSVPFQVHYAAPLTGALFAVTTHSLRRLWIWRRYGFSAGKYLVPATPWVCVFALLVTLQPHQPQSRLARRSELEAGLKRKGGAHLVIVSYGPNHALGEEWVYNEPDIDGARVVWARDMGQERNQELVQYFSGRSVWLLKADEDPLRLLLVMHGM